MACNIVCALLYLYGRSGCRADTVASALTFHPPVPFYDIDEAGEEDEGNLHSLRLAPELQHYPPYEHLTTHMLKTKNGTWVPLLCFRVPGAQFTVVFSHGNATDCGAMYVLFYMLARNCGINVVGYDYTGYGASAAYGVRPTERQTYQDIETVYDWCTGQASALPSGQVYDHKAPPLSIPRVPLVTDARTQLVVYGQSLGSGPSCYIAGSRKRPVAGLALHSPILSGLRVLTPSRALWCFDIFPNIDRIRDVQCKVLVMHGQEDREVGLHHGLDLLAAVPPEWRAEPWWVPDRGHNDLLQGNEQEYFRRVSAFLDDIESSNEVELTPQPPIAPSPTPGPPKAVKHRSGYVPSASSSSASSAGTGASSSPLSQPSPPSQPTTNETSDYSPVSTNPNPNLTSDYLPVSMAEPRLPLRPTQKAQHTGFGLGLGLAHKAQHTDSSASAASTDGSGDGPAPNKRGLVQTHPNPNPNLNPNRGLVQTHTPADDFDSGDTTATTNAANEASAESAGDIHKPTPTGNGEGTWARAQSAKKAPGRNREVALASGSGDADAFSGEAAAVPDDPIMPVSPEVSIGLGYAGKGVDTTTLLSTPINNK